MSFYYAEDLTQKKMSVPDAILKGIASVPSYAGSYARNVLEWKNVPGEIMKAILSDPHETYYYAQNVFWGRKAPEEIIKILSTSPYSSYYYAKDLTQEKMSVPDAILKGIASDPNYAHYYATDLNWKNVPDVIMKSIISGNFSLPDEVKQKYNIE